MINFQPVLQYFKRSSKSLILVVIVLTVYHMFFEKRPEHVDKNVSEVNKTISGEMHGTEFVPEITLKRDQSLSEISDEYSQAYHEEKELCDKKVKCSLPN